MVGWLSEKMWSCKPQTIQKKRMIKMGTRGAFGFYKNGENKITYNHYDSYPDGLGEDLVNELRSTTVEQLNAAFERIQLVNETDTPTREQIQHCKPWTNLGVSNQSEEDWYCLLRNAQGSIQPYLEGLSYMSNSESFMKDSLFNEWSYIFNLDDETFEVYKGFQQTYQDNRYAVKSPNRSGYYAVAHVVSFPLQNIPNNWKEQVQELIEEE